MTRPNEVTARVVTLDTVKIQTAQTFYLSFEHKSPCMDKFTIPEVDFGRISQGSRSGAGISQEDSIQLLVYGVASEARKTILDVVTDYDYQLECAVKSLSKLGIGIEEIPYRLQYCNLNRRSNGIYYEQSILTDGSSVLRSALNSRSQVIPRYLAFGSEQLCRPLPFSSLRKSNVRGEDEFVIHCVDLPLQVLETIIADAGVSDSIIKECESIWKQVGAMMYAYKVCFLSLQNLDEERHVHHMILRALQTMVSKVDALRQPAQTSPSLEISLYPLLHTLFTHLWYTEGLTPFSGVPDLLVQCACTAAEHTVFTESEEMIRTANERVEQAYTKLKACQEALAAAEVEEGLDGRLKTDNLTIHSANVKAWEDIHGQYAAAREEMEKTRRVLIHSFFRTFLELKFPAFRHGGSISPGNGLGAGAKSQTCGQCIAQQDVIGGGAVTAVLTDGITSAPLLLLPHVEEKHVFLYLKRDLCPRRSVINTLLPILLPPQALLDAIKKHYNLPAAADSTEPRERVTNTSMGNNDPSTDTADKGSTNGSASNDSNSGSAYQDGYTPHASINALAGSAFKGVSSVSPSEDACTHRSCKDSVGCCISEDTRNAPKATNTYNTDLESNRTSDARYYKRKLAGLRCTCTCS